MKSMSYASSTIRRGGETRSYETIQEKVRAGVLDVYTALKSCGISKDLERGRAIHAAAVQKGEIPNVRLASTLVDMYAKCSCLPEAQQVFDSMRYHDAVSWTVLILGYAENGEGHKALELVSTMLHQGFVADALTFVAAIKACGLSGEPLDKAVALHSLVSSTSYSSDVRVENTLIDLYAKSGCPLYARRVFDQMRKHTAVSWTALILGYAENGEEETALDLFWQMQRQGCCVPDALAFVSALKACSGLAAKEEKIDGLSVRALERGRTIHLQAGGYGADVRVANTLVDMYGNCGATAEALHVFDQMRYHTVVSWNALMYVYAENGEGEMALDLYSRMEREGKCAPNARTFVAALKACTVLAGKEEGKQQADGRFVKTGMWQKGRDIHLRALAAGCCQDVHVANTLIDMYGQCGCIEEARQVFDSMLVRSVVSWTVLIFGYVENGECHTALDLFRAMETEGLFEPDARTYVAALKASGMLSALETGRALHTKVSNRGLDKDPLMITCLVDMYGKCGSMVDAQHLFDQQQQPVAIWTWTALMSGYSRHGDSDRVFELFNELQDKNVEPDNITFLCLLTACSHAGLVEKGREYLDTMHSKHGVQPDVDHYLCMVDMLGRANQLPEAVDMVKRIPFKATSVAWTSVLAACRKWKNAELGRLAFDSLLRLDEMDAGGYMLMASIYASRGMWLEQSTVEQLKVNARARKKPGQSWWTSQSGQVHGFVAEDMRYTFR